MKFDNYMILDFPSRSSNEAFARSAVACFAAQMDPTLEELGDVKVAVSEAVTNGIIHGYGGQPGKIRIRAWKEGQTLTVQVEDRGKGIPDIEKAMEPMFTTKPEEERSGMGFSFMEAFTDDLQVESHVGEGTRVTMVKKMGEQNGSDNRTN